MVAITKSLIKLIIYTWMAPRLNEAFKLDSSEEHDMEYYLVGRLYNIIYMMFLLT